MIVVGVVTLFYHLALCFVSLYVTYLLYQNSSETLCRAMTILNNLPTVTTRRTLNLMNQNINRLTAEEKQIATDKNWVLAN